MPPIRSIRVSHIVLTTGELANILFDHFKDDAYKDKEMLFKMFAKMATATMHKRHARLRPHIFLGVPGQAGHWPGPGRHIFITPRVRGSEA